MDEADLLADHIAILAAPGKLVAYGSPVALKRDLGEGYTVQVTFGLQVDGEKGGVSPRSELLETIRAIAPQAHYSGPSPQQICYHLKTRNAIVVGNVLQLLDKEKAMYGITSYDVLGTSIEDIFLTLMAKDEAQDVIQLEDTSKSEKSEVPAEMNLTNGRAMSPLQQALTIFYKRYLIARRSWLTPVLAIIVAVVASTIPLVFISGIQQTCVLRFQNATNIPLYLPLSPVTLNISSDILTSPPGITSILGNSTSRLNFTNFPDNSTFVNTIAQDYRNLSLGGISIDPRTRASLFAWEASPPGYTGLGMLNLVTNILLNNALNASGNAGITPAIIEANYSPFPGQFQTLVSLKWVAFFCAGMVRLIFMADWIHSFIPAQAVFPAFYALYVSRERRSSVQAMQMSNGLGDPIGLWLGHLMFDTICTLILATIIIIIFQATASYHFHGLGFFVSRHQILLSSFIDMLSLAISGWSSSFTE